MLTQHEMRIIKTSLNNMFVMYNSAPTPHGGSMTAEYVSRQGVLDLLEEFTGEEKTAVTTENFTTLFRDALSEVNPKAIKPST